MKFNDKKLEWKKRSNFEDSNMDVQMRREKRKERREKYKVKNQKFHQIGYDPNDEYGGMF